MYKRQVKKELGEKSEQFATKIYKEWNWQNVLVGIVLGFVIGCGVKAHDKPTLPPFDSLPKLEQGYIKAKLREAQLLMDMHKAGGNVLRDELVAQIIKKNPALKTASPELQITFAYIWQLQSKRIRIYECARTLERQCKLCKEGKSQIGCTKNRKACDFSRKGEHNYAPSRACDATFCLNDSCSKLGWSREMLIANAFMMRGVFLLVKKTFYNSPNYSFEDKCLESGVDWTGTGRVCSKEFDGGNCFADFLHFGIRTDRGFCQDERLLEEGGIFLIL